ncbi:MAG: hypothetical protein ACREC9_15780 [Methylocella sp.]
MLRQSHTGYSFKRRVKLCRNLNNIPAKYLLRGKVRFVDAREMLKQPGKAMIHSSRQDRKTKAIAEVLTMIADAHPEPASHHPRPVRETEESLWESVTEFCAALEKYYAGYAMQIERGHH